MNDDYLFDKSGPPDPEVERLEGLLRPYAYKRKPKRGRVIALFAVVAAAAAVILYFALRTPIIAGEAGPIASHKGWMITRDKSARLQVPGLGDVTVDPHTRLRVTGEHRLELANGTIHAKIKAPPRLFVVDTPSAAAVDLGCAYTMTVDASGTSWLRVTAGWVSLEKGDRFARVPGGAVCQSRRDRGPGTPYYEDAPQALRDALVRFDFESGGSAALKTILEAADQDDAITVWHLLFRVNPSDRESVATKLEKLVPPPTGVTHDDAVQLRQEPLDRWERAIDRPF